ncbi:PEP-CTERM sorting domain-containing protein [Verrucomicrobiaceae bacterium N1E253]|uniref:PEP-CTERM sorting domain-containing protein n=1 Tax=Oceaniferula marina TaxID=2748318 RepID=A0A851GGY5_9BACT|nr:PEP-CTERM sorting domain-containing protein [Oceaniferula marina]NWK57048.1 PEP-CTERM sorting domain-containing protein [Oceaniferula marina]
MKRLSLIGLATAGMLHTISAASIYTYDMEANVGSAGTLLSSDGWIGGDLAGWQTGSFSGDLYSRNTNDGDNTITRPNDAQFSFHIPAGSTFVRFEVTGRMGAGFFQLGLSQGSSTPVGFGADFNNNDKYFILDGSTRHYESGNSYSSDSIKTVRLDLDLVAGTADLILDPNGGNTIVIDDRSVSNSVTSADSLYIRNNTRYNGPSTITITVIPEPSSTALLGVGAFAVLMLRRR